MPEQPFTHTVKITVSIEVHFDVDVVAEDEKQAILRAEHFADEKFNRAEFIDFCLKTIEYQPKRKALGPQDPVDWS